MINGRADRAAYQRLADILREEIMSGRWPAGYVLPSVDGLERQYHVSRPVAQGALRVLRQEGLIEVSQGRRAWVRDLPPMETVWLSPGASLTARMPTRDEVLALDLAEGVPVAVIEPGGRLYPTDRFVFRAASPVDSPRRAR